jgi:3-deoxy-manno-octulosonate cytidylyltransferase (CMP-KDO synthetase)
LLNGGTGWTAGTPAAAHKYPVFLVSGNPYNAPTMADDVLILIPARMASIRLPGKPLADIAGLPMIVQVLRRAEAARLGPVVIACDDETIVTAVEKAGGRAIMTRADHPSGSDRIFEALGVVDPKGRARIVVNVQGDLPTLAPADLAAALTPLDDPAVDIATLAAEIKTPQERTNPNVVKVIGSPVAPRRLRALYFTRATAPSGDGPLYHHIGLYAYRRAALEKFVKLPPSALEQREKLEQLRALEAGMRIDVAIVDTVPLGVDTPEDLETARRMLR